jgi:XisI protein
MDKLIFYRNTIKKILTEYSETRIPVNNPNPGYQLIFDETRDSYLLYRTGWREEYKRFHFCVFHLDIINHKIWVQEDATDFDIVGELEAYGISREEIVLAFHAPYKRVHTGYALA